MSDKNKEIPKPNQNPGKSKYVPLTEQKRPTPSRGVPRPPKK